MATFLPKAPLYARDRNHVVPGHSAVSKLSAAIRHRLVSEDEVAMAVLRICQAGLVEKFIQEIYWRRYWKAWLSLRPQVWTEFRREHAEYQQSSAWQTVGDIERAESGNEVINHFSRELVETGYLHNHARMWFAAWWVHEAKLPWQLGAGFFFRHLLDGDPASNTLSWRWVAGLQTPGKTYLARRANLEKYLSPEWLESLAPGLAAFENPKPFPPPAPEKPAITLPELPSSSPQAHLTSGLWIHEEDLSPETSPLSGQDFRAILVTAHTEAWEEHAYSGAKCRWLESALADAAERAGNHWQLAAQLELSKNLAASLVTWAISEGLEQIVAFRPEVGPLNDALPALFATLARERIHLALVDRPRDLELRPLATGGFFQFWEKMRKRQLLPA